MSSKPVLPQDDPFRLGRTTLHDQVADALQEMILQGRWKPGDRLPTQNDLAQQFSVSLTVIREAIQTLKVHGLVNVIQGKGTLVVSPDSSNAFSALQLFAERKQAAILDLWEVRYIVEPGIARLAARRASTEALQALEALVAQVRQGTGDMGKLIQIDLQFHHKLAEASGNLLLPLLLGPFTNLMLESLSVSMSAGPLRAPEEHTAILQALRARDPDAAFSAMLMHLERTKEDILFLERQQALATNPTQSSPASSLG